MNTMSAMITPDLITHEYLESLYAVTDAEVQERVNHLDRQLSAGIMLSDIEGLDMGTERSAYYDPFTNLVYKRLHEHRISNIRETARLERIALFKAHQWLEDLRMNVRYAETRFYVASSGIEYMVQEYVPDAGARRVRDVLTDEVADILYDSSSKNTGLSKDYEDGNFGSDPVTGEAVIIDLLEIRPWVWW